MRTWHAQSDVKRYQKCHAMVVPKYRRRSIYGSLRRDIRGIARDLCQQRVLRSWRGMQFRTLSICARSSRRSSLRQTQRDFCSGALCRAACAAGAVHASCPLPPPASPTGNANVPEQVPTDRVSVGRLTLRVGAKSGWPRLPPARQNCPGLGMRNRLAGTGAGARCNSHCFCGATKSPSVWIL